MSKRRKPYIPYEVVEPFGAYLGFVSDEQAFLNETKRLGWVVGGLLGKNALATAYCDTDTDNCLVCIIAVSPDLRAVAAKDITRFHGILVHESFHVLNYIFSHYGEHKPGEETSAYLLQYIFQGAVRAFEKQGFAASP